MANTKTIVIEKIGGSASATNEQIAANVAKFARYKSGHILVVSGPGGTEGRLTDELILLTEFAQAQKSTASQLSKVEARLQSFSRHFNVTEAERITMANIKSGLAARKDYSRVIREGDEFAARLYQELLTQAGSPAVYVDIANAILLDVHGNIDRKATYKKLVKLIDPNVVTIVSGHPGVNVDGTFANVALRRGYTDTTGMVIAAAFDEAGFNVTFDLTKDDVPGILRAHPNLVDNPEVIPTISIAELETMSISGAQVVKDEVAGLLEGTGVKLKVHNPSSSSAGTVVVNTRTVGKNELAVGIANKSVIEIKLNQRHIDDQPGAIADFARVFKELRISIKEAVTTSDSISFYISSGVYRYRANDFRKAIKILGHEAVVTYTKRNMIVLVGEALRADKNKLKAIEKIISSVRKSNGKLSIDSFWNNDKEPSIYLVVSDASAAAFVKMLYSQFF